jgi:glutaconate CoA-transferase subunit A
VSRFLPLAQAVAELIHDGDTVALEGFTHLIPFAAATRSSASARSV